MQQGIDCRSPRPAGRSRPAGFVWAALLVAATSAAPAAARSPAGLEQASAALAEADARSFRADPAWFAAGDNAAERFMTVLATSVADGIDTRQFNLRALHRAVGRAADSPRSRASAEGLLDQTLLRYVSAVRAVAPSGEWTVNDREALPVAPSAAALLGAAAASPSLGQFIDTMPWMHPYYAGLRRALIEAEQRGDRGAAATLKLNLDRVRMLPAPGAQRYVLVNVAAQRLSMVDDGQVIDSMRVVVGKASQPTPMMAAMIRYTAINPYWNLPSDLVAERVAPNVVKLGLPYLKAKGYVVLSDWTDQAKRVDPTTIDWKAVLAGSTALRMRQEPGPANAMGRMKFMFPNQAGVYLHDTPDKQLLQEPARLMSAGCVRLEDAPRLARWLYGHPLKVTKGMKPEQHVELDAPVAVYLAYLTAEPSAEGVDYYDDIYGRDAARMAAR